MKTKEALKTLYGHDADGFTTRLADIANQLVEAQEHREASRMEAAELRDALAGHGPMLDQLQHALHDIQRESLTDSRLPAVMAFDAYCVTKDASKENPSDRGLKQASLALYDRWNRDPLGHLTVGELVSYRDHFADMFPKSAVKTCFDRDIPEVGFNTLTNLPHLTRIASEVTDQASYEAAMERYGLDGDRQIDVRARAYIKGIAELALSDDAFTRAAPTIQDAADRLMSRLAQEDEADVDMSDRLETDVPEGVDEEAVEEDLEEDADADGVPDAMEESYEHSLEEQAELPHDEESEEHASINSPVTGDELVVALGSGEPSGVAGMDVELEPPMSTSGGALPSLDALGRSAQMMEAGDEEFDETQTIITDPSSGQDLQMTLRPVEEAPGAEEMADMGESAQDEMESEEPLMLPAPSGWEDAPGDEGVDEGIMTAEAEAHTAVAPEGWEGAVRGMKKDPKIDNPWALANWMKSKGYKPHKKGQKISREKVRTICASMGLTAEAIEEQILNGDALGVGRFLLRIGATDDLELCRLAEAGVEDNCKVVRTATMADFDDVVADFMALAATQVVSEKTAESREGATAYVVTADVPEKTVINARRMMASVWKIVPDAEGELLDDGRLAILVKSAERRDLNRLQRVLSDVFGSRSVEAQLVDMTSPYKGTPPVEEQPAGCPAKPMKGKMQTPQTGSGAQKAFIDRHTDPLKTAESAEEAPEAKCALCGDEHKEAKHDHRCARKAQLDAPDAPAMMPDASMPSDLVTMPAPMAPMPGSEADASQMPLDIGSGQLDSADEEAVFAAMTHFRNMGMLPLEAIDKFVSSYSAMLDKYGDESDPRRGMAEAGVVRVMSEAFQKPAIIPASKKKADAMEPSISSPAAAQGDYAETKMSGEKGSHAWGGDKVPSGPQEGSSIVNKGVELSDTNMDQGDPEDVSWGPNANKSPKGKGSKGKEKKADLTIRFDPELGDFHLLRGEKKVRIHASFNEALEDAERRRFGTDAKLFVDDGAGNVEEA